MPDKTQGCPVNFEFQKKILNMYIPFIAWDIIILLKNHLFGTTQRDDMGREEGGGFRMGNTCIPVADSF